jgi:hypothetical protein
MGQTRNIKQILVKNTEEQLILNKNIIQLQHLQIEEFNLVSHNHIKELQINLLDTLHLILLFNFLICPNKLALIVQVLPIIQCLILNILIITIHK